MEASKAGPRCGVCRRTELEGEKFLQCKYCEGLFCPSHIDIHQLGCESRPKGKRPKPRDPYSVSTGRKVEAVVVTVLIVGSVFAFLTYPGATQGLEGAIGGVASYLSNYVGGQVQSSGSGGETTSVSLNGSTVTLSITTSQSTTAQTSNQAAQPLTVNAQWVASFMAAVNSHRSANLTENSALDQFAANRFNTLTANYQITHYNFQQDVNTFFSGVTISVAEEYFIPNLAPAAYAQYIQGSFAGHWDGLVDPTYVHYGFYVGSGPVITRIGSCGAPLENLGTINETAEMIQYNCRYTVQNLTYFVLELGN